jgi:hypothetical protein
MVDQVVVVLPLGLVVLVHILVVLQLLDLEEILVVLLLQHSSLEVVEVPVVRVKMDKVVVHLDEQVMVD